VTYYVCPILDTDDADLTNADCRPSVAYTVTVTDANGCKGTGQDKVTVNDYRCGNRNQNMTICYFKLGATMGGCNARNGSRIGYEAATTELPLQLTVKAYPNPVQDAVTVEVLSRVAGIAAFEVLDVAGRARQTRQQELVEGLNEVEFRLGTLPTGIYLIKAVDALGQKGVVRVSKE